MNYLTVEQVIRIHERVIEQSGGSAGILDLGKIESAVASPQQTFGGVDLYPTLVDKASCLGFSLASNHGFRDGNKRIAHAAMESFLEMNGSEIDASVDEQESIFLNLAAHQLSREEFKNWLRTRIKTLD